MVCEGLVVVFPLFSKYLMAKAMQAITTVVVSFLESKNASMKAKLKDTYTSFWTISGFR